MVLAPITDVLANAKSVLDEYGSEPDWRKWGWPSLAAYIAAGSPSHAPDAPPVFGSGDLHPAAPVANELPPPQYSQPAGPPAPKLTSTAADFGAPGGSNAASNAPLASPITSEASMSPYVDAGAQGTLRGQLEAQRQGNYASLSPVSVAQDVAKATYEHPGEVAQVGTLLGGGLVAPEFGALASSIPLPIVGNTGTVATQYLLGKTGGATLEPLAKVAGAPEEVARVVGQTPAFATGPGSWLSKGVSLLAMGAGGELAHQAGAPRFAGEVVGPVVPSLVENRLGNVLANVIGKGGKVSEEDLQRAAANLRSEGVPESEIQAALSDQRAKLGLPEPGAASAESAPVAPQEGTTPSQAAGAVSGAGTPPADLLQHWSTLPPDKAAEARALWDNLHRTAIQAQQGISTGSLSPQELTQQLREGIAPGPETPQSIVDRFHSDPTSVEKGDITAALRNAGVTDFNPNATKATLANQLDTALGERIQMRPSPYQEPTQDVMPATGLSGPKLPPPNGPEVGTQASFGPQWEPGAGVSFPKKALNFFIDALNAPRAVLASVDYSYPLRQGWLAMRHGKEWSQAFAAGLKAWTNDAYARETLARLAAGERGTLQITGLGENLSQREEQFLSRWVNNIPGVRRSQQAATVFINKLRADVYDSVARSWADRGVAYTQKDLDTLGHYINAMTGRGNLGNFENAATDLATALFSPRLLVGRVQAPLYMFNSSSLVRQEAIKDFLTVFGATGTLLALGAKSGAFDVNLNPNSSDFGKIRVGATRIDPWGGYQQMARLVANLYSGETTTLSGTTRPQTIGDTLWKFLRSKAAPGPSWLIDAATGKSYTGEDINLAPASVKQQFYEHFVPLFWQDLIAATKQEGAKGAALTLPEFFGAGGYTIPPNNGASNGQLTPAQVQQLWHGSGAASGAGGSQSLQDWINSR